MRRGTRVGQAYVAVTADGDGINEEIVNSVDEAGPGVERAGRDQGDRWSEGFFDRLRDKMPNQMKKHFARTGDESGAIFGDRFVDRVKEVFSRKGGTLGDTLGNSLKAQLADVDDEIRRILNTPADPSSSTFRTLITDLRDAKKEASSLRGLLKEVSGNGIGNGRSGRNAGIGAAVGGMFGAGSRNDFLNLFGKSLGGIVGLIGKVGSAATGLFSTFKTGFTQAAEGASLLQKTMGGFSAVGAQGGGFMASIAKSGPAAIAVIAVITVALSLMASVLGALIGLVTALASTIVTALVGGLGILGGAIFAVVAAGGLLTAAFMSMTDAQKNLLSSAFQPLKAEMVGIGQIMLQEMVPAFATWSANLQRALMLAVPVAHVMGQAFADAGNRLTASFSGPGFQMMAAALGTYLPSIVARLSSALGSFLNGMMGLFSALMPYVNQFAGYLAVVAARFSQWATSAQGQNAIADWVSRAVVAIRSLWGFVSAFSGFLATVFFSSASQNAGNTIFDAMARKFRHFSDVVRRAAADGSLQKWFNSAIKFGASLWKVIEALTQVFFALYSSGVISGIAGWLRALAGTIQFLINLIRPMINAWSTVAGAIGRVVGPAMAATRAFSALGSAAQWAMRMVGAANSGSITRTGGSDGPGYGSPQDNMKVYAPKMASFKMPKMPKYSMPKVQSMGNAALAHTSSDYGGYGPSAADKRAAAQAAAQNRRQRAQQRRQAAAERRRAAAERRKRARELSKQATTALRDISKASGAQDARDKIDSLIDTLQEGGQRKRPKNIANQKFRNMKNVDKLVKGQRATHITLTEFATARQVVAEKIEAANEKLQSAITLRDEFKKAVVESIRTFAALTTSQAKTIDGVEQSLTAADITSNLQERLTKIQDFQTKLKMLVAQGLSNDAYKQIVDAGVEGGTPLADALLAGGTAAIQQTNSLVGQINNIANTLGTETSKRMYQAGVDAAQGLVDGLESISAKIDKAATKLGNSIAHAIAKSLGIKSPSRRAMALMDDVGDGAVIGLDNQHVKVGSAATRLADLIAVNPGGRPPSDGGDEVSGNGGSGKDPRFRDLIVQTPTENPEAVAHEVLNEVVGRLP